MILRPLDKTSSANYMWREFRAERWRGYIRWGSRSSPANQHLAKLELCRRQFARKLAHMAEHFIRKASIEELDAAFQIVEEYYDAASVIARDSKEQFAELYFGAKAGVWLAWVRDTAVGCIALRALPEFPASGEIRRMYVQLAHRRSGIAKSLLGSLEAFAAEAGYQYLYLDSAPGMKEAVRFYQRNGYESCPPYNDNPQAAIFLRKKVLCAA